MQIQSTSFQQEIAKTYRSGQFKRLFLNLCCRPVGRADIVARNIFQLCHGVSNFSHVAGGRVTSVFTNAVQHCSLWSSWGGSKNNAVCVVLRRQILRSELCTATAELR